LLLRIEFINHSQRAQALTLAIRAGAESYDSKIGKALGGLFGLGMGLAGEAYMTMGEVLKPNLRQQQLRMWNEVYRERRGKPFWTRMGLVAKGSIRNTFNGWKYIATGGKQY
jgi:hypothetical protein